MKLIYLLIILLNLGIPNIYGQNVTSSEKINFIQFIKIILTEEKFERLILPDNSICNDHDDNQNYYYILNSMTPFKDTTFRESFSNNKTFIITNTGELFYCDINNFIRFTKYNVDNNSAVMEMQFVGASKSNENSTSIYYAEFIFLKNKKWKLFHSEIIR